MAVSKIQNSNSMDMVGIIPINGKVSSEFTGAIYRCGRSCYLFIGDGTFTANANESFGTVPVGYRPVHAVDFLDSYSKLRIQINEEGQILCKSALNNTIIRCSVMYLSQL